ncbi:TPA: hypothetical protein ACG3I4_001932 [Clostridioides difficile]|uniref:hypothetical protein n=1 Tax=Clostridioides difficile TaxID=1496 RepID=UPI0015906975|nr:hypothetical protein [Clostridioides difficile]MDV9593680.1 hypothetical protein [Clostridioides difficile]MDV9722237.1 hypothetical protein [Clostridioides difficile]HBG7859490.1 hypothetical protein [Clostridioides difficile]
MKNLNKNTILGDVMITIAVCEDEKEIQIVIKNQVDNILKSTKKEYRIKKI